MVHLGFRRWQRFLVGNGRIVFVVADVNYNESVVIFGDMVVFESEFVG